ncbi:hypothetical protein EV2_013587 [Malus domestica]
MPVSNLSSTKPLILSNVELSSSASMWLSTASQPIPSPKRCVSHDGLPDIAEQEYRKKVLRDLNSLISGADTSADDDAVDQEVTDTEWFFLVSMTQSFVNGGGLPGQAFFHSTPVWVAGLDRLAASPCERARQGQVFGLQTMVCVPTANGVVELGSTELIYQSSDLMNKVRVLFDFNNLEVGSWPMSGGATVDQGENDPSSLWLNDPSTTTMEMKDPVNTSATTNTSNQLISKPVQFDNHPSSSSLSENPSPIQVPQLQQQVQQQQQTQVFDESPDREYNGDFEYNSSRLHSIHVPDSDIGDHFGMLLENEEGSDVTFNKNLITRPNHDPSSEPSDSVVPAPATSQQPERPEQLERSESLLAKKKCTAPIIVCRKRSSILSKPSAAGSSFGQTLKGDEKKKAAALAKPKVAAKEQVLRL